MATTILAVDDSVTMRKILEITFAGTDFQLVAVGSGNEAASRMQQGGIGLVICDNSLDGDGYEVAKNLKSQNPSVPLLFLSSRQNPYDAGRGSAAHADDHIDKPFDTQQLIDRVNKLAVGGGASASAAAPAAAPAPVQATPPPAAAVAKNRTIGYGGGVPQGQAPVPAAAAPKTAGFGAGMLGSKPAAAPAATPAAARTQPTAAPAAAPARSAPAAAAPAMSAAVGAANGQLAAKVGEMGLTPQQADAILALSRDLLERVVWEVVPVLAESLIKEEIARLTK